VRISGAGIAGFARGDVLRLRAPRGEPRPRRPQQEQGGAECALDRRFDFGPHRLDDVAQPPDARGAALNCLKIVADRLLARDV
jgi:hypothetical protein